MIVKNILIIIDMQNDFVYGKFKNKNAQKIINKIDFFANTHLDSFDCILLTQDSHNWEEFPLDHESVKATYESRHFPAHCRYGTEGEKLVFPLGDLLHASSIVDTLTKCTFDGSQRINHYVKENWHEREDILFNYYLCGVCTDICVLATAIGLTKYKDTNAIIVYPDLCAGTSPKAHKTAITAMKSYNIKLKNWRN